MMKLRRMNEQDLPDVQAIWNEVVDEGGSFPFLDHADVPWLKAYLHTMDLCKVLTDETDTAIGMYALHPNIGGRCGSIANATYLIECHHRGKHYGELLVKDSLKEAKQLGYRIMQFNGVVDSNIHARHLYARCGFQEAGIIPKGFQVKDGHYEDMHILYCVL